MQTSDIYLAFLHICIIECTMCMWHDTELTKGLGWPLFEKFAKKKLAW